jgi:hypothetical protein
MRADMWVLDQAKELANLGYSVIPLAPGSKRPDIPWKPYQTRRAAEAELVEWFRIARGLAIITGRVSGSIVGVDIDSADAKTIAAKALPPTPMKVLTPSGGEHWYYKTAATVRNGVKLLGTDLDVRGEGGYLVCPPTRLLGQSYRWLDNVVAPGELPQLDPALIQRPVDRNGEIRKKGDAQAAQSYIGKIMSIAGEGGDAALFKAACALIQKFELPHDQALGILQAWNRTNAQPAWQDDRLRYKLNEAIRLHGKWTEPRPAQLAGFAGIAMIGKPGRNKCMLCIDKSPKKGAVVRFTDETLTGFLCNRHMLRAIEARGTQHGETQDDRDSECEEQAV